MDRPSFSADRPDKPAKIEQPAKAAVDLPVETRSRGEVYADTRQYVVQIFKAELRAAIQDPSQLPDNELSISVRYEDGSPEAFLHRLWRDLYGDEPVDA